MDIVARTAFGIKNQQPLEDPNNESPTQAVFSEIRINELFPVDAYVTCTDIFKLCSLV